MRSVHQTPLPLGFPSPALDPLAPLDPVTSQQVEIPTHSEEILGCQTSELGLSRSVSQSNKYLKTGQGTRRPAGLAAGGERPRWLRGLERHFGRAEGGAWPEQNRRWMERERNRRVRRKLPSTPHTKKRKPGQAPAGPASAGPAGRTRARARADNGWECHVEIEWVDAQWLTPHCGGLSAGRGAGAGLVAPDNAIAVRSPRRRVCARRRAVGLVCVVRSIAVYSGNLLGRARGRSYIESIRLPTVLTSQGRLMDRLCTYARIVGRDSGSVATDPPSFCVPASAYVRALIRYRNPTCYASKKS